MEIEIAPPEEGIVNVSFLLFLNEWPSIKIVWVGIWRISVIPPYVTETAVEMPAVVPNPTDSIGLKYALSLTLDSKLLVFAEIVN